MNGVESTHTKLVGSMSSAPETHEGQYVACAQDIWAPRASRALVSGVFGAANEWCDMLVVSVVVP